LFYYLRAINASNQEYPSLAIHTRNNSDCGFVEPSIIIQNHFDENMLLSLPVVAILPYSQILIIIININFRNNTNFMYVYVYINNIASQIHELIKHLYNNTRILYYINYIHTEYFSSIVATLECSSNIPLRVIV